MPDATCLVVEHKSTALDIGPGSPYWKRLVLDAQVSKYLVGARALGVEATGVLYDVLRKPQLRPLKATPVEDRKYTKPTKADPVSRLYSNQREADETPDEYRVRVRNDIAAKPDKYYQRGTVVRLEDEERDAAYDAWVVARQIRESQVLQRWPRNVDACDSYGSFCPYFEVCAGEASIDDPTRYRDADGAHEELGSTAVTASAGDAVRRKLPLVTASSLRAYRSCARKYFYAYERRRRSIGEASALRFGTLIHRGLEVWWKTVDLDAAFAAMAGEADPFERAKAEEMLRGYHARWADERYEVLAVEVEFTAALVNPQTGAESRTWQRGGKIDALVRVCSAA